MEADDDGEAQDIADQIRREAPAGTRIRAGHAPMYQAFAGF